MRFKENETLDKAIGHVLIERENEISGRQRRAVRRALWWPPHRRRLERALTTYAMAAGALGYSDVEVDEDGYAVYVGDWTDLFDWFLENWPQILEIIQSILLFF